MPAVKRRHAASRPVCSSVRPGRASTGRATRPKRSSTSGPRGMDTSDPPGNERPAAEYLRSVLQRDGVPVQLFEANRTASTSLRA